MKKEKIDWRVVWTSISFFILWQLCFWIGGNLINKDEQKLSVNTITTFFPGQITSIENELWIEHPNDKDNLTKYIPLVNKDDILALQTKIDELYDYFGLIKWTEYDKITGEKNTYLTNDKYKKEWLELNCESAIQIQMELLAEIEKEIKNKFKVAPFETYSKYSRCQELKEIINK